MTKAVYNRVYWNYHWQVTDKLYTESITIFSQINQGKIYNW